MTLCQVLDYGWASFLNKYIPDIFSKGYTFINTFIIGGIAGGT